MPNRTGSTLACICTLSSVVQKKLILRLAILGFFGGFGRLMKIIGSLVPEGGTASNTEAVPHSAQTRYGGIQGRRQAVLGMGHWVAPEGGYTVQVPRYPTMDNDGPGGTRRVPAVVLIQLASCAPTHLMQEPRTGNERHPGSFAGLMMADGNFTLQPRSCFSE